MHGHGLQKSALGPAHAALPRPCKGLFPIVCQNKLLSSRAGVGRQHSVLLGHGCGRGLYGTGSSRHYNAALGEGSLCPHKQRCRGGRHQQRMVGSGTAVANKPISRGRMPVPPWFPGVRNSKTREVQDPTPQ